MQRTIGRNFYLGLGLAVVLIAALGFVSYTGVVNITGQANAAKAEPKYGGTIYAGLRLSGIDPKGWDPGTGNYYTDNWTSFFAEKLMAGDWSKGPMGSNEYGFNDTEWFPPHALKGYLAESWEWTDPLTLDFKLRKGIKFQNKPPVNGRELTSEDVAYSWDRLLKNKRLGKTRYAGLKSISTPDKYTVVFKMNKFQADWRFTFGYGGYNGIYPREMVEAGPDDWKNACGTGPYMVSKYVRGNAVTFVKNPDYWGTEILGGKEYKLPFADKIIVPIIRDSATRLSALRTGKVDMLYSIPWSEVESLQKSNPNLGKKEYLRLNNLQLFFKMATKPFNDVRVRKAMNMALDRDAMGKTLYGGKYEPLMMSFYQSWGETLYTPIEKLPPDVGEAFKYNPERAKQLLAEAGYPKGFTTKLVYPGTYDSLVQMMVAYFSQIGVTVNQRTVESNQIWSIAGNRDWEGMIGFPFGESGPLLMLQFLMPGEYWNAGEVNDKKLIEMYDDARHTRDWGEAQRKLKAANVQSLRVLPWVTPPNAYAFNYWQPWLGGFHGEDCAGFWNPAPVMARIWTHGKK